MNKVILCSLITLSLCASTFQSEARNLYPQEKMIYPPEKNQYQPEKMMYPQEKNQYQPEKMMYPQEKNHYQPEKMMHLPEKNIYQPEKMMYQPLYKSHVTEAIAIVTGEIKNEAKGEYGGHGYGHEYGNVREVHGTVKMDEVYGKTLIKVHIEGLQPNAYPSLYIHEFGITKDTKNSALRCASTGPKLVIKVPEHGGQYGGQHGGQYGGQYGGSYGMVSHGGNIYGEKVKEIDISFIGTLKCDSYGTCTGHFESHKIKLSGPHSVLGRSVVLEDKIIESVDYGKGSEYMNKGYENKIVAKIERIACGVIGIDKPIEIYKAPAPYPPAKEYN